MKGNLTRLVPAVERELRESESRSERRRAEGALAASEERTRLIIEHAIDAVVSFTARGQITEWNLRAEELFGRSRVEVIGRPFHDVVLAEPARRRVPRRTGRRVRVNLRSRREAPCGGGR